MPNKHRGRELINTGSDKRYVRRDAQGRSKRATTWAGPLRRIAAGPQKIKQKKVRVIAAIADTAGARRRAGRCS